MDLRRVFPALLSRQERASGARDLLQGRTPGAPCPAREEDDYEGRAAGLPPPIHLAGGAPLSGRSAGLGNQQGLILTLPVTGELEGKWPGLAESGLRYWQTQRLFAGPTGRPLTSGDETGFTLSATDAVRSYGVEGGTVEERFFVPTGSKGFVCSLSAPGPVSVVPEVDLRYAFALNGSTADYQVEMIPGGVLVSNLLPGGTFDDRSESFVPDPNGRPPRRLYLAIAADGPGARVELLAPDGSESVRTFPRDAERRELVLRSTPEDAPPEAHADHAPLWRQDTNVTFMPARLSLAAAGDILYACGDSREAALAELAKLQGRVPQLRREKADWARALAEETRFSTGDPRTDLAYQHVLMRLMDMLVVRRAGTAPREPSRSLAWLGERQADVAAALRAHRPTQALNLLKRTAGEVGQRLQAALLDRLKGPRAPRGDGTVAIHAGNAYFNEPWTRDQLIAVGFALKLGRFELARQVIRDAWQLQDPETGRLPQRIRLNEEPPYHSSDGTLWALVRLAEYGRRSGDMSLFQQKRDLVRLFFQKTLDGAEAWMAGEGTRGLLRSGGVKDRDYLWETWMDTELTPRDGYPAEIQMLWLSALRQFAPLLAASDPALAARMAQAAEEVAQALRKPFVAGRGLLADRLDRNGQPVDLLTPNPYLNFAIDLDLSDPELEDRMLDAARAELAGQRGVASLAPSDWPQLFPQAFLENPEVVVRDADGRPHMATVGKYNYHRGVEWHWLALPLIKGELSRRAPDAAHDLYLSKLVRAALDEAGVGGISELFDAHGPHGPEYQTWSMAAFLEALRAFAGVDADVQKQRISIAPQLPSAWPRIASREWYEGTPFDLTFERTRAGRRLELEFPKGLPQASLDVCLEPRGARGVDGIRVLQDGEPVRPDVRLERGPHGQELLHLTLDPAKHLAIIDEG